MDVIDTLGVKGRLALVNSAYGADGRFSALGLISNGRQVLGVSNGDSNPQLLIPQLIDWHLAGRFPLDRLVAYCPFDQLNQAMADMASGKAIKPVIRF